MPHVFAIIPAAGRSSRMGTAKQLLDVGGRTMLSVVLEPLRASCIVGVVVVTYSDLLRDHPLPDAPDVHAAINDDPETGMIDSIRIGLHTWKERQTLGETDGILVCPADQPGITTTDFDACIDAFESSPARIIIATRDGVRGHPIIFPTSLIPFVESPACDAGLRELPRAHPDRVHLRPCASPGVTRDIDTPDDYTRLQ